MALAEFKHDGDVVRVHPTNAYPGGVLLGVVDNAKDKSVEALAYIAPDDVELFVHAIRRAALSTSLRRLDTGGGRFA